MSQVSLQNAGLSENEAKIYEILLKNGEISVSRVISESKIKRPTVYKTLEGLQKKGLVELHDIRKKLHAKPLDPTKILDEANAQLLKSQEIKRSLEAIIPAMSTAYINSTQKPIVRTYEGVEGLKEIYNDLLVEKKPISAILQAADVEPELYEWLTTTFVKKRAREKIHVKAIVASSKESRIYKDNDIKGYRISVIVPADKFPIQHEIDIYGDKVAIMHYKKDEPLIGLVIHHPNVAKSMKAWFDLAFEGIR